MYGRRNPMRAEDHQSTLGNLVCLFDEDRPAFLKRLNDILIVDDFFAHINRRPVYF
jgi:hypothetical protein